MTEIKIIFRFSISEVVVPSLEQFIKSDKNLNIISGERIRNEFLKSENEIAEKINNFCDKGELIPDEYWCPFWTAMIVEDRLNVFTSMIGDINQFKKFEKCIASKNYVLSEIIYLKLNNIPHLIEIANQKYSKLYDNFFPLQKDILRYSDSREAILKYAQEKYDVTIGDFFTNEIRL